MNIDLAIETVKDLYEAQLNLISEFFDNVELRKCPEDSEKEDSDKDLLSLMAGLDYINGYLPEELVPSYIVKVETQMGLVRKVIAATKDLGDITINHGADLWNYALESSLTQEDLNQCRGKNEFTHNDVEILGANVECLASIHYFLKILRDENRLEDSPEIYKKALNLGSDDAFDKVRLMLHKSSDKRDNPEYNPAED